MKRKKLISAAVSPLLVLCLAVPASAAVSDTDISVKGKYEGNYGDMATLVLGRKDTLSLGNGQTMQVSLTNELDYGLRMVVTPVSQSDAEGYAWLSGQTSGTGISPYAYHVAFYDGSTKAALDGEAVIRLTIPSGYGNAAFYYMDNSGNLSRIRAQKQGRSLSFSAQNGGYYLFLKPLPSSSDDDSSSDSSDSGSSSGGSSSGGSSGGSSSSGSSGSSLSGGASPGSSASGGPGFAGTVTSDPRKGIIHSVDGILTGTAGSTVSDGRSHWILDNKGWRLRYADGTYASGTYVSGTHADGTYASGKTENGTETSAWEKVDGSWYLFGADGYARFGWYLDTAAGHWYYLDVNTGMKTGWHEDPQDGRWYYLKTNGVMATGWMRINGKWYYFNDHAPEATWEFSQTERIWKYRTDSDGRPYGSMYRNEKTPDGYFVDGNGVWDGKNAGLRQ